MVRLIQPWLGGERVIRQSAPQFLAHPKLQGHLLSDVLSRPLLAIETRPQLNYRRPHSFLQHPTGFLRRPVMHQQIATSTYIRSREEAARLYRGTNFTRGASPTQSMHLRCLLCACIHVTHRYVATTRRGK